MTELKPCPFCGMKAALRNNYSGMNRYSFIQCTNYECGISGKKYVVDAAYSSDALAIEFWNRRVSE